MYKRARQQAAFTDFNQAAGLNLNPENRWIKYLQEIPWESMEEKYAELFPAKVGYPAKPFRLVMGALLIQQVYSCPDRELVKMIQENPYMQYFCGYREYDSSKEPFNASALVGFRKRLTLDILSDFNNMVLDLDLGILKLPERSSDDTNNPDPPSADGMSTGDEHSAPGSEEGAREEDLPSDDGTDCTAGTSADETEAETAMDSPNSGTLIIDAACAPSNIRFPQDTSLLNEAREKAEGIIDRLHEQTGGEKPGTYRIKAAKQYKSFVRKRRPTQKDRRKAIHRQLGYLKRDLEAIEKLRSAGAALSEKTQICSIPCRKCTSSRSICTTTKRIAWRTASSVSNSRTFVLLSAGESKIRPSSEPRST